MTNKLPLLPCSDIPVGSSNFHGLEVNSTIIRIFIYSFSLITISFVFLPQFADIVIVLAVAVGAGVRVRVGGGGEGVYNGVGAIGGGCSTAGEREDAADSVA